MDMPSLASLPAPLAAPSQHARLIQLDAPVAGLVVERFHGREAVCADFRFDIDVFSPSASLDLAPLLAQPLALRLLRADGDSRTWHGLCTEAQALGADGGLARYRLAMEPWTALLRLRRNALIFPDRDLRGVLEQVFADYPQAAFRFDVSGPLPVRPIITQYRESDATFVFRLLAEAGLAWRFEQRQGDTPAHTLVVFDSQAQHPDGGALRFHRIDISETDDAVASFAEQRQAVPSAVHTGSWRSAQVATVAGGAEVDPGNLPPL